MTHHSTIFSLLPVLSTFHKIAQARIACLCLCKDSLRTPPITNLVGKANIELKNDNSRSCTHVPHKPLDEPPNTSHRGHFERERQDTAHCTPKMQMHAARAQGAWFCSLNLLVFFFSRVLVALTVVISEAPNDQFVEKCIIMLQLMKIYVIKAFSGVFQYCWKNYLFLFPSKTHKKFPSQEDKIGWFCSQMQIEQPASRKTTIFFIVRQNWRGKRPQIYPSVGGGGGSTLPFQRFPTKLGFQW